MNFWVADPDWGAWIIAYFFFGGIAAGSYFLAVLLELFGTAEDRPLARIGQWIAFPLVLLCTVFLVVDLGRPERFWHMLFKSEIARAALAEGFPFSAEGWRLALRTPLFKYWSPMSAGSWALSVFGACAFVSFLTAVWPERRAVRWLGRPAVARPVRVVGGLSAFYVASYTGSLLGASNQPIWSDTTWLSALFLASSVSTGLAAMTLIARWRGVGSPAGRERLERADLPAIGLEFVLFAVFLASLGSYLLAVLATVTGNVLIFGTLVVGLLVPLVLHLRYGRGRPWGVPVAAACVLLGGFLLRFGVVTTPGEILARGPGLMASFGPEEHRRAGQRGADPGNHDPRVDHPRSKLGSGPEPP